MLMMDEAGWKATAELRQELEWLLREHPDKVQLAAVARGHLEVIDRAGSCDSAGWTWNPADPQRTLGRNVPMNFGDLRVFEGMHIPGT